MKKALKEGRSKGLSGKKKSGPPLKTEEPVLKRSANDDGERLEESTERQTEEKQTGPSAEQLPVKDPATVVDGSPSDKPSSEQPGPGASETKTMSDAPQYNGTRDSSQGADKMAPEASTEEEVQSHEDGPVREVTAESGHAEIQEQPGSHEEKGRGVYSFPFSPDDARGLTFDSTSHVEVSSMSNEDYSKEIITDTLSGFDLEKIRALIKAGNKSGGLKEAEKQVKALWQGLQAIEVHTDKYSVIFLDEIGTILTEIRALFEKPSDFTKWIKDRFEGKHIRYLQHARQIAGMGPLAEKYASLGKNRLLDFYRLQKSTGKSCDDLIKAHPFTDTAEDDEGKVFSRHVGAIITFCRFKDKVDFVEFAQAQILAAFRQGAIEVGTVKKVAEWLSTKEEQKLAFEEYVQDGGVLPKAILAGGRQQSLVKILADLNQYESRTDWDSVDGVDPDSLRRAYRFIRTIAGRLAVDLDEIDDTDIEGGENS